MTNLKRCARANTLLVAALAVMLSSACQTSDKPETSRPALRVSLGIPPFGESMAEELKRSLPQFDIEAIPATEPTYRSLQKGTADWGVERADLIYAAHTGVAGDTPEPNQLRGVALLQPLPMYLIVRANSGIRSVADLKGRKIAVGPMNTSSWTIAELLLPNAGIWDAQLTPLSSRVPAAAGLKDGTFDAAFFPGYVYPDDVVYSAIREGAYLVPVEGAAVEKTRRQNPFVRVITIPRNVYPGQDRLVPSVGIDLAVVCRAGLDEQLVHDATRQLFQVYPRLSGIEASLRFLNFDNAPATPIPLHPGAARYYRERQLSR